MWDPCVEHATNSCLACRFCKFWQKPMWIHPENGFKGFGVIGIIEGEKKSTTKTLLLNPYQAWTISLHCTLAVITPSLQKLGWLGAAGVVLNAKHNERLYIIILWVSEYLEGILWRLGSRWLGVCRWCKLQATAKVSFVSFRNMFREMWFRIPGHWSQVTMVLVGRIQEVPECANVFFFWGGLWWKKWYQSPWSIQHRIPWGLWCCGGVRFVNEHRGGCPSLGSMASAWEAYQTFVLFLWVWKGSPATAMPDNRESLSLQSQCFTVTGVIISEDRTFNNSCIVALTENLRRKELEKKK